MNDHIIIRRMQSEKITVKCSTMTLEVNVMAEGLLKVFTVQMAYKGQAHSLTKHFNIG